MFHMIHRRVYDGLSMLTLRSTLQYHCTTEQYEKDKREGEKANSGKGKVIFLLLMQGICMKHQNHFCN